MNRFHTTLAIAGLCAVIVGWQVWRVSTDSPDQASGIHVPIADEQTSAAESTTSGPEAPARETTHFDFAKKIETDADCYVDQIVLHPETGEPVEAYACDPSASEPHPYENWSEQVLAGLAYGDPVAAEVLGLRHIQSEDPNREALGLMLLYRAVALTGDTTTLHRAISERYAVVSEDGTANVHNLKQLLVFGIVASRLGDGGINYRSIAARLAKAEVEASEVTRLKSAAEQILREMASIESEVTGNTKISEALTNA